MKVYRKLSTWFDQTTLPKNLFNRIAKTIFFAALLLFGVTLFLNIYSSAGPDYFLTRFIIYTLVALFIAIMGSFLIKVIGKFSWQFRAAVIFSIISVLYFYSGLTSTSNWILVGILILLPILLVPGFYFWRTNISEKRSNRRKTLGALLAFVGLTGLLFSVYTVFIYKGSTADLTSNVKMMGTLPPVLNAPNPARTGTLKVAHLSYGRGKDKHRPVFGSEVKIKTQSVDASGILKSWDGFFGKLRSHFFGFNAKELPLNALVWYPEKTEQPSPLVLIVHGNHLAEDFSESGYAYLAKHLASKGYIVASVDENFLNKSAAEKNEHLKNENATRAWLLLKHLELWRKWNKDPSSEFYQKVDMENIALIGHSRGGEAIGHAALFNTLPYYPDDAKQAFNFDFSIKSLVAIAPVDGQYKPGKKLTELQDVNYLVLQGAQDMDMKSFGGLATYHRIKFSENFRGFKAGLYIKGANHGQFNSVWGRYDQPFPAMYQYNTRQLMPQQEQQEIAKVYITAFLNVSLKGEEDYKPIFMDYRYGREWLPNNIYFNQFEQSGATHIATFEEDFNVETTTLSGGTIKARNLSAWHEQENMLAWNGRLTNAAYIRWNNGNAENESSSYSIQMPDSLIIPDNNHFLTFTLAQEEPTIGIGKKEKKSSSRTDNAGGRESLTDINFEIRIEDVNGKKIDFLLSDCSFLQTPIQRNLAKFSFLEHDAQTESIPDFFYYDILKLSKGNSSFKVNELKSISFVFDKTPSGAIILDNVGLMNF